MPSWRGIERTGQGWEPGRRARVAVIGVLVVSGGGGSGIVTGPAEGVGVAVEAPEKAGGCEGD